jgi:hypothetical protein
MADFLQRAEFKKCGQLCRNSFIFVADKGSPILLPAGSLFEYGYRDSRGQKGFRG